MKTIITSILPSLLVLLAINTAQAGNDNMYPFNYHTNVIVADTLGLSVVPIDQTDREDEIYVDDIPFNTKEISARYFAAHNPVAEPEPYVNDIPFRTDTVAGRFLPSRFAGLFPEPEKYINDIPFNTGKIAEEYLNLESGRVCCQKL